MYSPSREKIVDLEPGQHIRTPDEPPAKASVEHRTPPERAPAGATSTEPQYGDSSEKLFSVYVHHANEHDTAMVEGWNGDMDSILIFVSFWLSLNLLWLDTLFIVRSFLCECHRIYHRKL